MNVSNIVALSMTHIYVELEQVRGLNYNISLSCVHLEGGVGD